MQTTKLTELMEGTGVKFGTSGVRGLVAAMTDELCYGYTQAFLQAIAQTSETIVIGHDLRPSSPGISAACIAAIEAAGKTALYAGALPTPALASYALAIGAPCIVVTGSHIPFDRNGIKFYSADGEISKEDEHAILASTLSLPDKVQPTVLPTPDESAYDYYVARYVNFFGADALAGSTTLLYQHSSVARDILADILTQLGCKVITVGRTDTFVPIDTEAVRPEDVTQARAWAEEFQFDAIFSTDGDADRPLLGDEQGQWLRGDIVGILCASYLGADWIATPVSCNSALELCRRFPNIVRTRIGSPYVIAGMEAAPAGHLVAGYEANGGFLLGSAIQRGDHVLPALATRDAVLPMVTLLVMAREQGIPLSELVHQLPARFTYSDRLQEIPTDTSRDLLIRLEQDPTLLQQIVPIEAKIERSDKTDGLRLYFDNGDIVHFRPSGNAPELRCYCESSTTEQAQILCDTSLQNLRKLV